MKYQSQYKSNLILDSQWKNAQMKGEKYTTRGMLILTAARKLFLSHGYDDTSLEMIISESGGSRRSIYSEFNNKQGLFIAVVKFHIEAQLKTLQNIDYNLSPEQALIAICENFIERMISPEMISLFRLVNYQIHKMPEVGMLIYENGLLMGHKPIIEYFEYLEQQNILTITDKEFAAHSLINMAKTSLHMKAILAPSIKITKEEITTQTCKSVNLFLKSFQ